DDEPGYRRRSDAAAARQVSPRRQQHHQVHQSPVRPELRPHQRHLIPRLIVPPGIPNPRISGFSLWQHRTIWQEHSAKDFASYESYKRAVILYVFPPFITARMGQKIGRRPQTQLCGDALYKEVLWPLSTPYSTPRPWASYLTM